MVSQSQPALTRKQAAALCEQQVLDTACKLYAARRSDLRVYPGYEGAANLVYEYQRDGQPLILRFTYTQERSAALVAAELDFVNYLGDGGVRVSRPVRSENGHWLETVFAEEIPFHIVSFIKGKGMRVPDNGYRYREEAPIEEYFQNWGQALGQMHALSQKYQPLQDLQRPLWFDLHRERLSQASQLPDRLALTRQHIHSLLAEVASLPQDEGAYGLIHGDFNDGNFTVDYTNGDITVFDFDDSCYFWFVYELAAAWEGGVGRTMFAPLAERRTFMDHYMEQVMAGYNQFHSLRAEWLDWLPLFTRLIQVEEFLHYVQYLDDPDPGMQNKLGYLRHCIEAEIPYMGFFEPFYSPDHPFSL